MFQRPGPYYEVHHGDGHPWFAFLLLVLLFGAVAMAALTLWRTYRQAPVAAGVRGTAPPPPPAPPRDPALAELRLRYARGEIDRDEYLQRATDLGDAVALPAPPPPAQSPAGDA